MSVDVGVFCVLDEADRLLNEDFEKEFNEDSFLVSGKHFFFQLQGQTRYICRFVNKSELHILFIVSHFFPLSSSQILYLTVQLKIFSLQIIPNILYCVRKIGKLCLRDPVKVRLLYLQIYHIR
ncbi:putative ATP-dependent RNA helicase DEAD-box [Medicago truncatula]|uniref:Putative ATP-dependent RNA helicase DEAD-box n=1 Tax=Medicago truncatula TaxID=3880 RepID=A0A396J4F5_MEDTR|nr:putative ATP-dependent RNA helicase DEAD-box [Medicago truncatula]